MSDIPPEWLSLIAAPMVKQSDLPFRILVRRYGATLAYTQMLQPERILNDRDYYEFHCKGLGHPQLDRPVVVQLCGNDPEVLVGASRKMQAYCDAIDLNLGCPQELAREGHYGAYLLGQKDWPLVENIVSSMAHSLTVPVSAKIRLCQPTTKTSELALRLEHAGASWIVLHARHVSAKRRRQGAADLTQVRILKDVENLRIPVVSNGNVRGWKDVEENRKLTGADGIMVGETLLGQPSLFSGSLPDPVQISLEYLEICTDHPDTVNIETVQHHVRHFIEFQCGRRTWFNKFRASLTQCTTFEAIERLLRGKVQMWRGKAARNLPGEDSRVHSDTEEPGYMREPLDPSGDDLGVMNLENLETGNGYR